MEIIFIRHGPPEFDSSRWLHDTDLGELLTEYRESRVRSPAPADLLSQLFAFSDKQVVCSTLTRSIDSAMALGFKNATMIPTLNEADLPNPSWLKFPIPYKTAIIALRLFWFMGYSGGSESYKAALVRADDAAAKLVEIATVHRSVLVVGHGLMNRLVSRRLIKMGWTRESQEQTVHWSVTRVTKLLSNGAHVAHS